MSGSDGRAWTLLAGAILVSMGLGAYELAPASVTPLLRESLRISPSDAGLVVGVMFGTAVVASLPAGAVLDRTDSRLVTIVAVGVLQVAGVWGWLAGTAGSFEFLLASRILGAVAYAVVWNAGIDVVARSFDPDRRATAVAIFTASGPLGFAIGQGGAPAVAEAFGWPAIFPATAALALVGIVPFWLASRNRRRRAAEATPSLADFGSVVTNRAVWIVALLGFLGYAVYLFVNTWAPSYLTEELTVSIAIAGPVTAIFPAVGVLSRAGGGVISDSLFGGRRRPVVLAAFVVATPVVAGFPFLRGAAIVAALLVAGFAIQLCLGLVYAYVRELVDPSVAATAVAFLTSVGLAGAFVSPIAGGMVIEAAGYDVAFGLAGVLGLVGVLLAWYAPEPGT